MCDFVLGGDNCLLGNSLYSTSQSQYTQDCFIFVRLSRHIPI